MGGSRKPGLTYTRAIGSRLMQVFPPTPEYAGALVPLLTFDVDLHPFGHCQSFLIVGLTAEDRRLVETCTGRRAEGQLQGTGELWPLWPGSQLQAPGVTWTGEVCWWLGPKQSVPQAALPSVPRFLLDGEISGAKINSSPISIF